ncbi:peptidoglycan-binding protein [Desulfosarcina ovata subsp. sediminis]|uniref:Peptidoglycan-binding protein n=1 Tax=Desulfosarcina ovata subsp. sediminis TaxID=885957 RepID=A0A5K7ZYH9_9BACT|nr:NlpC/P60 family protein [Desulfosarcina ovata]BBO85322.1 peptidoglycan-binding protein [Desulfosarcina ovata subsp. sediminis]
MAIEQSALAGYNNPMLAPSTFRDAHLTRLLLVVLLTWVWGCASFTHGTPSTKPPGTVGKRAHLPHPQIQTIGVTIQVGAFASERNASAYARRLQSQGLDAYHFIDTDGLYKVRFDRFPTKSAALNRAQRLRSNGIIDVYYIVRALLYGDIAGATPQLQQDLIQTAQRFIGIKYHWGGTTVETGMDCSGLTQTVYRLNGIDLPRTAREQYAAGDPVSRRDLAKGDLVFFDTSRWGKINHVGIYCGNNTFIHAPSSGKRIQTASLSKAYYRKHFAGARRYF